MLEAIIEGVLPLIIHIFEIMGIIVLTLGAFTAFYNYIKSKITKVDSSVKYQFASAMIMSLEFKLAAEILKTVLVRSLDELLILGSIFILRVLMTFVLEREISNEKKLKS